MSLLEPDVVWLALHRRWNNPCAMPAVTSPLFSAPVFPHPDPHYAVAVTNFLDRARVRESDYRVT